MQKTQTICLVILTTIAVGFSLFYLRSVLLPFVIALFVAISCQPILDFVEAKLKLHRFLAFLVAFSTGLALLLAFAILTFLSIHDLMENSSAYEKRLDRIALWVIERVPYLDEQKQQRQRERLSEPETPDTPAPSQGSQESPQTVTTADLQVNAKEMTPAEVIEALLDDASDFIQSQMLQLAGSLSGLLSYGVLILIFVFFLLWGGDEISKNEHQPEILRQITVKIQQYLVVKTIISAVTGFAFGFVLWLFGVPLAIVFGFLAFLMNFIPNIGPLIATLFPLPFLVLNENISVGSAITCFLVISTIQFLSGNVFETRIMGRSFDVSPVVLLLSLMFFGLIWGILGMFLATPIVSILKIVLNQNNASRPLAELMAGRWVPNHARGA